MISDRFDLPTAAQLIGMPPRTLLKYLQSGQVLGIKYGSSWRVAGDEIEHIREYGTRSKSTQETRTAN